MDMDTRPPPPRREPLDDEALLDHLAETALVETQRTVPPPPQACADDPLGAEMFLDIAAGFLQRRTDRAELIEKLRERVLPDLRRRPLSHRAPKRQLQLASRRRRRGRLRPSPRRRPQSRD